MMLSKLGWKMGKVCINFMDFKNVPVSHFRDFAYVCHDPASNRDVCHTFRCVTHGKIVAKTLRTVCKRLSRQKGVDANMAFGERVLK